ncbi:MAG: hypothetical protein KY459_10430 [Acidobacteria bacterium]|nr:hypothetical protein [Acidobacteriota bacterium]
MQERAAEIVWRLRLNAGPRAVFDLLSTDEGRASFWAERTEQHGDRLTFHFSNGEVLESRILDSTRPDRFSLTYFDESTVVFELRSTDSGGTDLIFRESNLSLDGLHENRAGWVSVLLNLKAQSDHSIDLRNHDPRCTWSDGYVDN